MSRCLTIRGPYHGPTGYDHHAREFVRRLSGKGIRIELVDVPEWSPARLPGEEQDPWFETLGEPVPSDTVIHFCMPHQVRPEPDKLNVNFTMFEATRIHPIWAAANRTHDLVVLPASSSRAAWVSSGVPEGLIRICPLGVDTERFHPGIEPLDWTDRTGRPIRDYRVRILNISEIGPRKNLLALLRVWILATRPADDAILVMKLGNYAPGWALKFMRDLDALEKQIGKTRRQSAAIYFSDKILPDSEMPRLFSMATHYWSMSHGEGWDLPTIEAGATGLKLIAPAHSAYLEYLDESVGRMIPSRRTPAVFPGGGEFQELFEGSEWWEPDEEVASDYIRRAVRGLDGRDPLAKERIRSRFTWDHATDRLIEIVEELHSIRGLTF